MFENVLFINIYYIYNKYYIIILLEQQKEITFLRGGQRIVLSLLMTLLVSSVYMEAGDVREGQFVERWLI